MIQESGQSQQSQVKMPSLFIGHGSPMNVVSINKFTEHFRHLGLTLPKPKAILCISAHWLSEKTEITASEKPKQIFDFYGFPKELYEVHYSPNGDAQLAYTMERQHNHIAATQEWGLDHGTWSILHHMYPKQDIPTLQLSINKNLTLQEHFHLAEKLMGLREQGVLILGSGNIVHNLRQIEWQPDADPHSWAVDFELFVIETLMSKQHSNLEKIQKIFSSPDLRLAHPTLEHLLPLIYVLGAASEAALPHVEIQGIQNAAISMATVSMQPFNGALSVDLFK